MESWRGCISHYNLGLWKQREINALATAPSRERKTVGSRRPSSSSLSILTHRTPRATHADTRLDISASPLMHSAPPSHAVESGGILGGAPPSLLRTQRAALMRVRTSLKSSRAGSETISARASCARGATVRATARGRPVRLALAQALA